MPAVGRDRGAFTQIYQSLWVFIITVKPIGAIAFLLIVAKKIKFLYFVFALLSFKVPDLKCVCVSARVRVLVVEIGGMEWWVVVAGRVY